MSDLPFPDVSPDVLHINAWFAEDHHPAIVWQLNSKWAIISLTEARAQAQALFQAIGYAEGEAAILKGLVKIHLDALDQTPGFSSAIASRRKAAETEALKMSSKLRHSLRQGRSPMLEGIDVIFGRKTRGALINVFWYGEPVQWETSQALNHAIGLIEAAEGAESDAFFRWWLIEKIGMGQEEAYGMIREFQDFRDRRQLEDLFKEGDCEKTDSLGS